MSPAPGQPEALSLDPESGGGLASLGGPVLAPVFGGALVIALFLWLPARRELTFRRAPIIRTTVRSVTRTRSSKGPQGWVVLYRIPRDGRPECEGTTIVPWSHEGRFRVGQAIDVRFVDGEYPSSVIRGYGLTSWTVGAFTVTLALLVVSGGLLVVREFAREARRQRIREQRRAGR